MSDEQMFSREEIQSGSLSRVRRARALVYLIEQEARRIRDQRAVLATAAPEAGVLLSVIHSADPETMRRSLPGESDEAFIESFRNARRQATGPQVRSLASTVDNWKMLLPEELALRAEVLHQIALRHSMPRNRVKHIAEAFGVGNADFDAEYLRVVGEPVAAAFAAPMGWLAWWGSSRKKG